MAVIRVTTLMVAGCGLLACGGSGPDLPLPALLQPSTEQFLPAVSAQLESLHEAATAKPRKPDAAGRLGMAYLAYGHNEHAAAALGRAHALAPGKFRWQYLYAVALTRTGEFSQAVEVLQRALESRPRKALARKQLGLAYMQLGELVRAREILAAVVADKPAMAEARLALARVLLRAGEPAAALEHLQHLLDEHGPAGSTYFHLADASRRLGHSTEAERYFELSERHRGVGLPSADRLMGEVARLDLSEKPLLRRSERLLAAGDTRGAIASLHEALERNPDSVLIHASLVGAYGALRQFDKADEHYGLALERGAPTAALMRNLGRARAYEKRYAEARSAFAQAYEINPHDARTLAWMAIMAEQQRDATTAEELFRRALAMSPHETLARHGLARLLHQQERYEESEPHYERLLAPETALTATAYRHLGEAARARGELGLARERLQRALEVATRRGERKEAQRAQTALRRLQR